MTTRRSWGSSAQGSPFFEAREKEIVKLQAAPIVENWGLNITLLFRMNVITAKKLET